ncbi:MAG: hypothetical protein CEN90_402 [Parcubacteria group bacterium Licking1014_17]|nr:MAG: hypothetical protein CEN90_402 [Parcubacteria group bacterium Licking1014_17]
MWYFLAFAITAVIVISGFDWYWYAGTQNPVLQSFLFPAAIIGGLLPFILFFVLYAAGKIRKNIKILNTALAVAQAGIVGWLISSFYKIFTGRIQPPFHIAGAVDISRGFQFGFFRHGIFWGWPSTHTAVAFAIAVAIFMLYQDNRLIKFSALFVAFYIGIGVSTNIHWFSDFIVGAIIGSVIGIVVGKSFLEWLGTITKT